MVRAVRAIPRGNSQGTQVAVSIAASIAPAQAHRIHQTRNFIHGVACYRRAAITAMIGASGSGGRWATPRGTSSVAIT